MNLVACRSLVTGPEHKVWYRAIQAQYWPNALDTAHTTRIPSRYSPATNARPAFPVLYLAEDHRVALFEAGALLGSPMPGQLYVPNPSQSLTIVNVQVTLQRVADLTSVTEQDKLQTSAQELTGDWLNYHLRSHGSVKPSASLVPTQQLGQALHRVRRFEGFRTISARVPSHMNLVVFPDRLRRGSSVVFTHPATGRSFRIP